MKANQLRLIKNNRAVMKLAPKRWPNNLPPPVIVADTEAKARAVSLLRCFAMRDHQPVHACDLTPAQARDVLKHISFPNPSPAQSSAIPAAAGDGSFIPSAREP